MGRGTALAFSLSLIAAGVMAAPQRSRGAPPNLAAPPAVQLMQSCDAHKFETLVTAVTDGQPHQSKVKLCGVEGQSDADWIKTLQDAITKLGADQEMAPAVRDQIVSAIKAEIARLTISGSIAPKTGKTAEIMNPDLSRDYAALPPLPPPRESPAVPERKDFAELPPLPATPVPAASLLSAESRLVPGIAPRVTFACETPGELASDAPCAAFERETRLTVHAGEDVPEGIFLQFVRNDQPEGDIPLSGLRRGKSLRVTLPASVCSGFASGKLELRIVHGGSAGTSVPLKTDGPYSLRC